MQQPPGKGLAESVVSGLLVTVPCVVQQQQWVVEEDLLGLRLSHAMLLVLAGIAVVPAETCDLLKIDHGCTSSSHTEVCDHADTRGQLPDSPLRQQIEQERLTLFLREAA